MSNQDVMSHFWNNYTSVITLTLISYEYLLQFEKEVKYVWQRQWSPMSYLYLVVRYFGLFIALLAGCWGGLLYMPEAPCYGLAVFLSWGISVYFFFTQVILIWRLYALYEQSKSLLYVILCLFLPIVALMIGTNIYVYSIPGALSPTEISTPNATYCTVSFNAGAAFATYSFIPIICYDFFLVVLAAAILVRHLKERRKIKMKPNAYIVMIVRYHMINFVLNLTNQVLQAILWAYNVPPLATSLSELFIDTAPFILAPRLIISIWDTHALSECVHVSTTFADCVCWTSPPAPDSEEHERDSQSMV